MKKKVIIILLTIILCIPVLRATEKSAAKAMLFSAVIPGSGEAYLGSYTKAGIFFTTELIILGTALRVNKEVDWATDTYQLYAFNKAGIPLNSDKDTYQNAQDYQSSADYNEAMAHDSWRYFVLGKNNLDAYYEYVAANRIEEENGWNWTNDKTWRQYRSYRMNKQNLEMYNNLAVASVVLNHIVSLIDTALTAKNRRSKMDHSSIYINPDIQNNGIRFGYAYKF